MPAVSPLRPRCAGRGFTMVEMVTVLLLVAILAAVAMPRLGSLTALPSAGWRDQIVAALLQARALAQGHRRLVCVAVATGEVRLTIAAANPATTCGVTFPGSDGDVRWARDSSGIALSVVPAGTLYFQPDGRVSSDGAGTTPVNVSITPSGETAITVVGETGHVQ